MFRLLQINSDNEVLLVVGYASDTREPALAAAEKLCKTASRVIVTQDLDEVKMAPMITNLQALAPPSIVYRGSELPEPVLSVPRAPQAKPRLLIVPDRRATPAEIFGNLMVVAEGKIVKNAFGALELADMPLTGPELLEVTNAMRGSVSGNSGNP